MKVTSDNPFTSVQVKLFEEYERCSDYDTQQIARDKPTWAVVKFKQAHRQFKIGDYLRWKRETEVQ